MELQIGVKILLKNDEGQYLVLRRNMTTYPGVAGEWDIVGGRIHPGTPLLENLAREVREETSLELQAEAVLLCAQDILRVPGKHVVRLTYVGGASGEVRLDPKEHIEYRWVTLDELLNFESQALDMYLVEALNMFYIKKPS